MTIIKHYGAESWCAPCRALRPVINEILAESSNVGYTYIDVDEEPAAAQQAGVRSIPVVIIEKGGVETNRFVGIHAKSVYEQAIK